MKKRGYKVKIEACASPDVYEIRVAFLMSEYFYSDVILKKSNQSYSPDLYIEKVQQYWEIKNIRGNSPHTIEHNLCKGKLQSDKIIISLLRTKMTPKRAIGRIKNELKRHSEIKCLILVTKSGKIVEIK